MYEYKVEKYRVKNAEKGMNELAKLGWRVVAVLPNTAMYGVVVTYEREVDSEHSICAECGSKFLLASSKMESLCPECAHFLYGYPNCEHVFENGKCIKCGWNGNHSEYIKSLLSDD